MIKIFKQLGIILTTYLLFSCESKYYIKDGTVYFETYNEGSGQVTELVYGADPRTFKELKIENDSEFNFGRDKNHLFINGVLIENIDPKSFKYLGNYFFRDNDSAYFFGFYNDIQKCCVKGINPNKIELLDYPWAKSGNILIHGYDTLTIQGINSFKVIDKEWGKSNEYVVYENKILYGSDSKTFTPISDVIGKDRNFHFRYGNIADYLFQRKKIQKFNFQNPELCNSKPTMFYDLHSKLETYQEEDFREYEVIKKLQNVGFNIREKRICEDGESKILTIVLTKKKCKCFFQKLYIYDYSLGEKIKNRYQVTERIYFKK
jgi:hypothetical protein